MSVQSVKPESTIEAHEVRQAFVSRAIYGLITVVAVLQTMKSHPPTPWHGAVTLFGATLAVALLEAYSVSIAEMLSKHRRLERTEFREIWNDVAPVLVGAQAPTVILVLAALDIYSKNTAIVAAEFVAFGFLFVYGWRIGKVLHESLLRKFVSGLLLVGIGLIIVVIKNAFH